MNQLDETVDLLDKARAVQHWKAQGLDFSNIFYQPKTDSPLMVATSVTSMRC